MLPCLLVCLVACLALFLESYVSGGFNPTSPKLFDIIKKGEKKLCVVIGFCFDDVH